MRATGCRYPPRRDFLSYPGGRAQGPLRQKQLRCLRRVLPFEFRNAVVNATRFHENCDDACILVGDIQRGGFVVVSEEDNMLQTKTAPYSIPVRRGIPDHDRLKRSSWFLGTMSSEHVSR